MTAARVGIGGTALLYQTASCCVILGIDLEPTNRMEIGQGRERLFKGIL